jgi:outer membrane protein assembly factor BamB
LVDGDAVIGTPGSARAALVKFNAETGKVIWEAAINNPGDAGGYSSPIRATIGDVPMYINLLGKSGGVVGVHAETGKLLWRYTRVMNGTANIPTVIVKLLKLTKNSDGFDAKELKYYGAKELQNHHGGVVLVGEHLFLGRGHNNGLPTCVEFKTANIVWAESAGAGKGTGSGCVVYADGMLYFRYQSGVVALVKATSSGFELMGRFEIPEKSGKPSWQHPVIANGKLYIRDQDKMHCYNLKK